MINENLKWYRIYPRVRGDMADEKAIVEAQRRTDPQIDSKRRTFIEESQAARVHDPLWLLARQYQFGEFQGEDAASPFYVEFGAVCSPIHGWRPAGASEFYDYDRMAAPLDATFSTEPFASDAATAVELGQYFESLLDEQGLSHLKDWFRGRFPISQPGDEASQQEDGELRRFLLVCAGRAIDGVMLFLAVQDLDDLKRISSTVSAELGKPMVDLTVSSLLMGFRSWVIEVFGDIHLEVLGDFRQVSRPIFADDDTIQDPLGWCPERLEYQVEVAATGTNRETDQLETLTFDAYPERDGMFEWYAFDQKNIDDNPASGAAGGKCDPISQKLLPAYVTFSGMPNKRWWQFENRHVNLPQIKPDLIEPHKLVLMDFMLVHGDNWFVIPISQETGTLIQVKKLLVYDVFGGVTQIKRAEEVDRDMVLASGVIPAASERWSLFSITDTVSEGGGLELADFFIMPPTSAAVAMTSETVEEVRFVRDEMANMVWAIERITENGIGLPWRGSDRFPPQVPEALTSSQDGAPLIYRLRTSVPEYWIPFLPVQTDASHRDIALERGAMYDSDHQEIFPQGRILKPTRLANQIHSWTHDSKTDKVYRIREERSRVPEWMSHALPPQSLDRRLDPSLDLPAEKDRLRRRQ